MAEGRRAAPFGRGLIGADQIFEVPDEVGVHVIP